MLNRILVYIFRISFLSSQVFPKISPGRPVCFSLEQGRTNHWSREMIDVSESRCKHESNAEVVTSVNAAVDVAEGRTVVQI